MMHVALGYFWGIASAAYHLERALQALGHRVTYVGLPASGRPGYDNRVSIVEAIAAKRLPPAPAQEQPDLFVWIDPADRYFPPDIEDLQIPTACYLIDVHLGTWREQAARFFDAVFIAQKDYLARYRQAVGHEQVYWLPLAAAADVHCPPRQRLLRIYEVGFVGNIALAHRGTARARRLKALAARYRTNDFYRPYSPEEVGQIYSQSCIVFNTSIAGDVTMRVFEGTSCGALVLTDAVGNGLDELFTPGKEIVVYRDDADLFAQIDYYLAHEEERARIARAGQRRTQAWHTYHHRVQQLLQTISAPGFRQLAPMREAATLRAERWAARRVIYTHLHMLDALLDGARQANEGPLQRARTIAPCLLRRLLL